MSAETEARELSPAQLEHALSVIAIWLGPRMRADGQPVPTGREAAYNAAGPMLKEDFDWGDSGPRPAIILEGGPEDWTIWASADDGVRAALRHIGVFAEPYSSWALCLYRL